MLQGSVSTTVDAPPEQIWKLLVDKVETAHSTEETPAIVHVLQRNGDLFLREYEHAEIGKFIESVLVDNAARKVTRTLVAHEYFEGYISEQILRSETNNSPGCIVAITVDWRLKSDMRPDELPDVLQVVNDHLFSLKEQVEAIIKAGQEELSEQDSPTSADSN